MAMNQVTTQILYDGGNRSVIALTATYNAACTTNTTVVTANTLLFANNAQPCVFTVSKIQPLVSFGNGYVSLQWVGATSNTVFANFGRNMVGSVEGNFYNTYVPQAYMGGPGLTVPNTANLVANVAGDLALAVVNAEANDSLTIVLYIDKVFGWQKSEIGYNASDYKA